MSEQQELSAGRFSEWLDATRKALADNSGIDVPCGDCTGCCRSAYFIHIQPGESDTLAHIPDELLFPAPGLPEGNVLMGYDEQGHCPMLKNNACSIYEHRPQTCRSYDCRIFPATGIQLSGKDKTPISQQVQQWKFNTSNPEAIKHLKAVKKAAAFLQNKSPLFEADALPRNSTQLAIMAIKVYDLFLEQSEASDDDVKMAEAIVKAWKNFENRKEARS